MVKFGSWRVIVGFCENNFYCCEDSHIVKGWEQKVMRRVIDDFCLKKVVHKSKKESVNARWWDNCSPSLPLSRNSTLVSVSHSVQWLVILWHSNSFTSWLVLFYIHCVSGIPASGLLILGQMLFLGDTLPFLYLYANFNYVFTFHIVSSL